MKANKKILKSLLATGNVLEQEAKSALVSSRQGNSRVRSCSEENVSREEQRLLHMSLDKCSKKFELSKHPPRPLLNPKKERTGLFAKYCVSICPD